MPDMMKTQPFDVLLRRILAELAQQGSIFAIPQALFYRPRTDSPYAQPDFFGQHLVAPIGPAAGPHTQLAQNIVAAWLCGGRFIELKTVQIMDELEIPRPCIDMEDEGYNVEWSQELKLEESAHEYIDAWALVHILHSALGMAGPVGTIFNMSVGYNLEGIQSPRMQTFMARLVDASDEIAEIRRVLRAHFPQFAAVEIPPCLTNSVTLSTMHGCPPDEIERIARYMLEERGLHTTVKLNPTLLGPERVRHILHRDLGFVDLTIPDEVFAHDLCYDGALALIKELQASAARRNLSFAVKLSNTLPLANRKGLLPGNEMYMSGRALYPLTMNLFRMLRQDCGPDLNVSYSAGADACNVTAILAAGACPVTVASDLLKPGGYGRLKQYLDNLENEMRARGASSLAVLARNRMANLEWAAGEALQNPRYQKDYHPYGLPKVSSELGLFDCVTAPCVEQCAVAQDVPEYAWLIAQGEYDRALELILTRNPLPAVTGYVCTHLCQTRCTRNNYDEPVAIRALKRVAAEQGRVRPAPGNARAHKVAVIGSGPSGLAAAYYLALGGVQVTIFEAKDRPGGMLALAPAFRLPASVIAEDIRRITGMGVQIELSHRITRPPQALLAEGFAAVYVACGFARDAQLDIPGHTLQGVVPALDLLDRVARGERPDLGSKVLVVGGGNTAMDAARTARRLTGKPVTVVYRRTRDEMPAIAEEVRDLLDEGNELLELATPVRVIERDSRVAGLQCLRNELGAPGPGGRRVPLPVPGSEYVLDADSIVVAIGQRPDVAFLDGSGLALGNDGALRVDPANGLAGDGVYAGGDAVRGPAIIIQACADGRRAAEAICRQLGIERTQPVCRPARLSAEDIRRVQCARARKEPQQRANPLPVAQRAAFDLVEPTLSEGVARREAARCLQCSSICDKCVEVCPNRANYAYSVAPVRLTLPRLACRGGQLVQSGSEPFQISQPRQIVHVADFCNECGNCATFCLHQGKPYTQKPRLFLAASDFARASDNAFYVAGSCIRRRERGQEACLTVRGPGAVYEDELVHARLGADFAVEEMSLKRAFSGELSLRSAAEMAVILKGVTGSLQQLVG